MKTFPCNNNLVVAEAEEQPMIAEYLAIVMRPKMTERKLVAIAVATIAVAAVAAIVELVALKLLGDYHQIPKASYLTLFNFAY